MKGNRKYLVVLLLTLAVAIYAEVSAPRPVDWRPSYSRYHRIPYGAYVLYELLADEQAGAVTTTDEPLYNTLDERYGDEPASYLIVNDAFDPDDLDIEAMLDFADDGGTVMIAAGELGEAIADTLGVEIGTQWLVGSEISDFFLRDSLGVDLVAPTLRAGRAYPLRVGRSGERWLERFDTARSLVAGRDAKGRTNFIRIEHGAGSILLHTVPAAFVNHNMLAGRNAEYAFGALSYLPRGETIWDEYYKAGRAVSESPLGVVLRDDALRWIWIIAITGAVLFVLVYARRRQRAIPVMPPPANTTLEFATTVGRLYYEHGDHRGIAAKKIAYFHEYLRSHLGLRIGESDGELSRRVAERSGVDEERVRAIFGRIAHARRAHEFGEADLTALNADLEDFYSNSKR